MIKQKFYTNIFNSTQSYQTQYAKVLENLINFPRKKGQSRIGDIHSNFAEQIRVDLTKEFPLMDIKKLKFSNILHELLWFVKGDTNIKYLIENDCHIWTDDAYRYYKEKYTPYKKGNDGQYALDMEISKDVFVEKVLAGETLTYTDESTNDPYNKWNVYRYGDLDRIYGRQWRKFNGQTDQLQNCINTLKNNPNDRRMIVTAHNPSDLEDGIVGLPSCHNYFQFYTEQISHEKRLKLAIDIYDRIMGISYRKGNDLRFPNFFKQYTVDVLDDIGIPKYYLNIFFNIRSNDWFLGQPYNMASYALLAKMVGKVVNMVPKELVMNSVDAHLYVAHFEGAQKWLDRYKKILDDNGFWEMGNEMNESDITFCKCNVEFTRIYINSIDDFNFNDFDLVNYNPQSYIKAPLLT